LDGAEAVLDWDQLEKLIKQHCFCKFNFSYLV
jgi:hypothetical protein